MKKLLGVVGGRLALFAFLLFMAAGCNNSGVGGNDSVPAAKVLPIQSFDTFGGTSDIGSGSGSGSGSADLGGGGDNPVAPSALTQVHNPEPASMVLLGIGLAAMLRRKRIQK